MDTREGGPQFVDSVPQVEKAARMEPQTDTDAHRLKPAAGGKAGKCRDARQNLYLSASASICGSALRPPC
jgi:hypothetical protein